jgi:aminoglycoside phosphotransferase
MSNKELTGHNNNLFLNKDGTVTKVFNNNGIITTPAFLRMHAEISGLQKVLIAPNIVNITGNTVTMTHIPGEKNMDAHIDQMPETLQVSLFESAGKALKYIHDQNRTECPPDYIQKLQNEMITLTKRSVLKLDQLGIKPDQLKTYILGNCNDAEIVRRGLSLTHGDYWLNNIMAKMNHKSISVSGVIDWELAQKASPYRDFAGVALSIIDYHPFAAESFWKGYGEKPDKDVVQYFCMGQILNWINVDQQPDFNSSFYKNKILKMKQSL